MKPITLAAILLVTFLFISCTPAVAATPHTVQQPARPEVVSTSIPATVQPPPSNENAVGVHFSGQGPTTWQIQKDPGMALLHLKVENCSGLVISGKGQNIPYLSTKLMSTDQFEDQYQFYEELQSWSDGEENIILDYPKPYEDYDAPPQTEMLRIQEVTDACKWEVSILPMTLARPIAPGQVLSGQHNDVLAVANDLHGLELLFMSPGHDRMLQDFGGVIAVSNQGIELVEESVDEAGLYEIFSPETMYLVIDSRGYWELQGK